MNNAASLASLKTYIPGGVDGNAKYFDNIPVAVSAKGCRITDIENREYIDYCCGYGPLIFGHNNPDITDAIANSVRTSGMLYGLPHPSIEEAIRLICETVPCAEMVRFTNSGTEATMTCIRLARGITKRDKIVKFSGSYHGTHDAVMMSTKLSESDPPYPNPQPSSAGLTHGVVNDTYVLPFNNLAFTKEFLEEHGDEVAAVLVEPMLGNYGLPVKKDFLLMLREISSRKGILLVFDEVVTAFRISMGGMQELMEVTPDLVALGKAMGGGFPIGAIAGAAKFMSYLDPSRGHSSADSVWHSGTYNASPVAMAGVIATINKLKTSNAIKVMGENSKLLRESLLHLLDAYKIVGTVTGVGPFIQLFFGVSGAIDRPEQLIGADANLSKTAHQMLIEQNIFFIPGIRGYVSAAHQKSDIEETVAVFKNIFENISK